MSVDESREAEISAAHLWNNSETHKKEYRDYVLPPAGRLNEGLTILHRKKEIKFQEMEYTASDLEL